MSVAIENLKNTEMPSTEIKSLKQTYNNTNTVNNNQNLSKGNDLFLYVKYFWTIWPNNIIYDVK